MTLAGGPAVGVAIVVTAVLLAAPPLRASDGGLEPAAWLERMATAIEKVSYTGTLVEFDGEGATVVQVVHRYDGGVATERLMALDEVGREIIHRGNEVTAILPDQQSVLVDRRDDAGAGPAALRARFPGGLRVSAAHYRLAAEPGGELLGRQTELVQLRPRDNLRYGYRLWLDRLTALPLKIQVLDGDGAPLEQVVFSAIRFGESPPAAVEPATRIDGFAVRAATPATPGGVPGERAPAWTAERLPPGFALSATRRKAGRVPGTRLWQLVYSDGVANVSVFIEPAPARTTPAPGGQWRVGAESVYTRFSDGQQITAMGEVPARTVELIALAMRPVPPASSR